MLKGSPVQNCTPGGPGSYYILEQCPNAGPRQTVHIGLNFGNGDHRQSALGHGLQKLDRVSSCFWRIHHCLWLGTCGGPLLLTFCFPSGCQDRWTPGSSFKYSFSHVSFLRVQGWRDSGLSPFFSGRRDQWRPGDLQFFSFSPFCSSDSDLGGSDTQFVFSAGCRDRRPGSCQFELLPTFLFCASRAGGTLDSAHSFQAAVTGGDQATSSFAHSPHSLVRTRIRGCPTPNSFSLQVAATGGDQAAVASLHSPQLLCRTP
jgi:hypothetical protein